jgi:hypothetical protein
LKVVASVAAVKRAAGRQYRDENEKLEWEVFMRKTVIAAAILMIVVPLLDQPAVADQSAAPTTVPQQPPIADSPQDFADRLGLDQRLQRLELQMQTLLNMQVEILSNTRKRAVQTRTETFPKSWVGPKRTATNYRHRRRHEIDETALAGETVDPNPAAQRGITHASGCPASVPCVEREAAPFTGPTATPEYDEAGAEVKGITSEQHRGTVPPAPAPATDVGRVITRQGANIRDVPTGSALRTVPRGTTLHVFARRDGWVQVGEEVPMGWVYSSLVKDAP